MNSRVMLSRGEGMGEERDDTKEGAEVLPQDSSAPVSGENQTLAESDAPQEPIASRKMPLPRKPVFEKPIFDFDEAMPSGHWAVPWSDLMMVAFVLFAVLYAYAISNRDISEAMKNRVANAPTKLPINQSPIKDLTKPPETPKEAKPATSISIEELFEHLQKTITVSKAEDVSVMLDQNKAIKVSIGEALLFDLGRADLKPDSINFLRKFSETISKTKYKIIVEGHTDPFPIHNETFPTNWELSAIRAIRVARFLIEGTGLEAERFSVVGHSLYKPVVPNSSPENKARNRRVEIIITREKID